MKYMDELRMKIRKLVDDEGITDQIVALIHQCEEKEKESRRLSQKKGIESAREHGVNFGRPRIKEPEYFEKICKRFLNHEISVVVAAEACGMGVSTFYRRIREIKEEQRKRGED